MNTQEVLNDILAKQSVLLDAITAAQKEIRRDVTARDWTNLEKHIELLQQLSSDFSLFEEKRMHCVGVGKKKEGVDYTMGNALYHEVRQKLLKSRIENDALNCYLSISRRFLQGVFDTAIPQRRNTLYSSKGAIVRTTPDSLILNTVL